VRKDYMVKNAELREELPERLEAAMLLHLLLGRHHDVARGPVPRALGLGHPSIRFGHEIPEGAEKQNHRHEGTEPRRGRRFTP
jgi:hypothetical protein